ncbi:hypothetical protein F4776DRAFT_80541 [Hypoxylon sp. NC0597]|nr:hypothetical protein F4776DRAFT_80541 [Hypoxylon sp. NC0597]
MRNHGPDADESGPPPPSQASSHFPLLEPVSGATLFELEVARRERLKHRGRLRIGCDEIDGKVLLGGFERGEVVGVSAEEAEFGLLVGLQTVAHAMVFGTIRRAAIVTTLPATAILPTLRDVIRAQVQAKLGPAANHRWEEVNAEVRRCLELISVSRVFDVEGLWEVLSELETPPSPASSAVKADEGERNKEAPSERAGTPGWSPKEPTEEGNQAEANSPILPSLREPPKIERTEIRDSDEDEDEELSMSSSLSPPPEQSISPPQPSQLPLPSSPPAAPSAPAAPTPTSASKSTGEQENKPHIPDLILITHFSSLLTNLFTRSADNKTSAHTTLQLLSSHLRFLARSASGPLIMLLNTTTSTSSSSSSSTTGPRGTTTTTTFANTPNLNPTTPGTASKSRPLEPTLRSIFNSAPIPAGGPAAGAGGGGGGAGGNRRQNKPAFGATFTQFLDLHLLCTRVPRTRADAEALFALTSAVGSTGVNEVRYCWVVEVLLDVSGVWEWDGDGAGSGRGTIRGKRQGKDGKSGRDRTWTRKSREQRWGAVDVRSGVRLVDAFQGGLQEAWTKGPVRVAAGFGGPPARGL